MKQSKPLPKGAKVAIALVSIIAVIAIVAVLASDSGGTEQRTPATDTNGQTVSTTTQAPAQATALVDKDGVKISVEGLKSKAELFGVGEGIAFLVENSRTDGVIISVSEASVNGMMKTVIQPQMPLNVTSAGKKSVQTFVFPDAQLDGAEVALKIHVLDADYKELFVTNSMTIQF